MGCVSIICRCTALKLQPVVRPLEGSSSGRLWERLAVARVAALGPSYLTPVWSASPMIRRYAFTCPVCSGVG